MKKSIEEIRAELLKDKIDGYVIPDVGERLLRDRVKANEFCQSRFLENPHSTHDFTLSDYADMHREFSANGELFYIVRDMFNLGYYRGYMKAKAEMKANSTDCH